MWLWNETQLKLGRVFKGNSLSSFSLPKFPSWQRKSMTIRIDLVGPSRSFKKDMQKLRVMLLLNLIGLIIQLQYWIGWGYYVFCFHGKMLRTFFKTSSRGGGIWMSFATLMNIFICWIFEIQTDMYESNDPIPTGRLSNQTCQIKGHHSELLTRGVV